MKNNLISTFANIEITLRIFKKKQDEWIKTLRF